MMGRLRLVLAAGVATAWLQASANAAPSTNPGWENVQAALARNEPVEARRIAEVLAAKGDPEAINGLSVLVGQGVGGPLDIARAHELRDRAIAGGSLAAKLNLARELAAGGDKSQFPRAIGLLQDVMKDDRLGKAVYYPLGRIMVFGGHGAGELREGVAYLKKAVEAEPSNADAQYLVARAFQGGWGDTEKDPAKAFEHFLAASQLGDERALRYVGMARLNGDGTARDPAMAFTDLTTAAEHGSVWSMIDIAVMLATGEGVPADPPQARLWYRRAFELGSAHGARGLGVMLYRGEGGAADPITGRAYLELAVEAGDPNARQIASAMFHDLSTEQRASVDAAKAAWLHAHPPLKPD